MAFFHVVVDLVHLGSLLIKAVVIVTIFVLVWLSL